MDIKLNNHHLNRIRFQMITRACLLLIVWAGPQTVLSNETEQNLKSRVQEAELQSRDSIGVMHTDNTESVIFSIDKMTDLVIKVSENQLIKATTQTYWKQNNIYVNSEYRDGEEVLMTVSNDSKTIVQRHFYMTTGLKFDAVSGNTYTLRFEQNGSIDKLVSLEITKTSLGFESKIQAQEQNQLNRRIAILAQEIKSLVSISEFGVMLHEKNNMTVNHTTCIYMTYLLVEAGVIVLLVFLQLKYLMRLLQPDSII